MHLSPTGRVFVCCRLIGLLFVFVPAFVTAEVVQVEVTQRSELRNFGYEEIVGRLHFEIDPKQPGNALIADVDLAPVNEAGRVRFSSDLRIVMPKDPAHRNGAAWIDIPNRGSPTGLDRWMTEQGFTLVNIGWEFDIAPAAKRLTIDVPRAKNRDGSPIRGVISVPFVTDRRVDEHALFTLRDYPAIDPQGKDSRLVIRGQAAYPKGAEVPRNLWSFTDKGLRLEGGFHPGMTYEVYYLSEAPPVAGLGYAAIRDAVAWLRNSPQSPVTIQHAYAFGSSQCGRFLRDFVYLEFNTDEQNRQVFDGILAHVAGAGRLVLNQRWSSPRAVAGYYTSSYPFADTAHPDPVSGHTEGILQNPRVKHRPKVFYTNMAAEYWGAGRVAALTHLTPDGTQDIPLPDNVRSYFFAGTSHGPAPFPPTSLVAGAPLANPVNPRPSIVALRQALHLWVTKGIDPPPSVYPRRTDGTLIPVRDIRFPKIPGLSNPGSISAGGRVRNPQWPDGAGEGTELPLLVPQVDRDGNDLGGIRMPDVAVPLGTATGWVFRPAPLGSPHELYLLRGAWIPFARTRAEREALNDPRASLEERYASRDEYLACVEQVLQELIRQRFLSEADLAPQLKQAGDRWDWVIRTADGRAQSNPS